MKRSLNLDGMFTLQMPEIEYGELDLISPMPLPTLTNGDKIF